MRGTSGAAPLKDPSQRTDAICAMRLPHRLRLRVLAVAAGCATLAIAAYSLTSEPATGVAVIWPAAGLAVGVLLLSERREWPALAAGIFAGMLAGELLHRTAGVTAAALAAVDTGEALLCALLTRRMARGRILEMPQGVVALAAGAVAAGVVGACGGATVLWLAGTTGWFAAWGTWVPADAVGILVLAPVVLATGTRPEPATGGAASRAEAAALVALTAALAATTFGLEPADAPPLLRFPFVLFPLLTLIAMRAGTLTTALASGAVALAGAAGTLSGTGAFAATDFDDLETAALLQAFVAVTMLAPLALCAVEASRRQAELAARTEAERLASVLRAATEVAIVGTDAAGTITEFNEGAQRMLGRRAEHVVGRLRLDDLHDPGELERRALTLGAVSGLDALLACARTGRSEQRDWTYVRADGTGVPVAVTVSPKRSGDGAVVGFIAIADELTQRRREQARARLAEQRMRDVIDSSPLAMAVVGPAGTVVETNPAMLLSTGLSPGELARTPVEALTDPDDGARLAELLAELRDGGAGRGDLELRLRHVGGDVTVTACHASRIAGGDDVLLQFFDLSERKRYESRLLHMADHDPLTGLLNRRAFGAALEQHVAQVRRYGSAGALMVLDLDNFKQVNDALGHRVGDELLVSIAGVLRAELRQADLLARLGGDEFAILLPRASARDAVVVGDKIAAAVRRHATHLEGSRLQAVTASIGIVPIERRPDLRGDRLLADADLAMYAAKDAGRNRVTQLGDAHGTGLDWLEDLADAVADERFALLAQPVLDLRADRIVQHELLLRLLGPDGRHVAPEHFLPAAERQDLMPRIDRWVLTQAVALLQGCERAGRPVALEVNLSRASIRDEGFPGLVRAMVARAAVDPAALVFEIPEDAAVADMIAARRLADALADVGCRFALDDFGAGLGSLSHLRHLPFDQLKIDGELVARCAADRTDQLVISSLVALAHGMGRATVAEFVGDAGTQDELRRLGVDLVQGFHIGAPRPLAEAFPGIPLAPAGHGSAS
jgi:diguanylate cyclase (GGDEF)-like protein/PAS domain S-box-containing protein